MHLNKRPNRVSVWLLDCAFVSLVLCFVVVSRAHAYIDPGSGALIWQALLAVCFGLMFYLRRIVRRVRTWVSPRREAPGDENSN
jgi:hypothetical protein